MGVIIFAIVIGLFPFQESTQQDCLYKLLINGKYEQFWSVFNKLSKTKPISKEFKSLMQKIFSLNGGARPTLE